MLRTFIGIEFPKEYVDILKRIKREWRDKFFSKIKWTNDKNFHLTLNFLGEIPDKKVEEIKTSMSAIEMESFSFQAGGGGFFPNIKKPRVMWVGGIQGNERCRELADMISTRLEKLGFSKPDKPFTIHLTLGRIKYPDKQDRWGEFLKYLNHITWPEIKITSFVLWKSELFPSGSVYTKLAEFPFKNKLSSPTYPKANVLVLLM